MKKKILALVLVMSLIMSMFALTVTTCAQSTVLGDADNSGDVTSNDALLVLRAAAGIEDGDQVEVDFDSGIIKNVTKGTEYKGQAFPPFMQNLIACGGLVNYINNK